MSGDRSTTRIIIVDSRISQFDQSRRRDDECALSNVVFTFLSSSQELTATAQQSYETSDRRRPSIIEAVFQVYHITGTRASLFDYC